MAAMEALCRFVLTARHPARVSFFVAGRFCLVWHCDGKGMPFATWKFEIFLAAALWKFVTGQELRVYPYLLAYALEVLLR
ncbi:hypothetical protein CLOM_g22517 [Closterium sp. NIES-68]|nr:hypothetical protein CLOM_g22517 [Closterium sp. NIES-68]